MPSNRLDRLRLAETSQQANGLRILVDVINVVDDNTFIPMTK